MRACERARVSRELRTETVQSLETEIFPLTSCSMVLSLPENVGHSARAELTKARAVKTSAETTRRDHILRLGKIFSPLCFCTTIFGFDVSYEVLSYYEFIAIIIIYERKKEGGPMSNVRRVGRWN